MKIRRRFNLKVRRSVAIAVAALTVAIVTGTVLASAAGTPSKQDILAKVQSAEATAAAGPRAPKPTGAGQGLPSNASCPSYVQTGVFPYLQPPRHDIDATFTTVAGAYSSAGDPYNIYAGARQSDPRQGLVVVERVEKDPCKVWSGQVPSHYYIREYPTPSHNGALTLTQIVGDTVAFNVADGSHSNFNYVTGQYE